MPTEPGTTRLVSFLGTGDYQEVTYFWEADPPGECRGRFVARALAERFHPREILVLATEAARSKHAQALREALAGPELAFLPIPDGRTEAELWEQFDILKSALRPPEGGRVVLDITHGFRTQPFFGAAVASFVRAVDRSPADLTVVYGAFEARGPDGRAPLWDVTAFVDLVDWSAALNLFLRTGRVEGVAGPAERLGRELRKQWFLGGREGPEPTLDRLARAVERFGADVETIRTGSLLLGSPGGAASASSLMAEIAGAEAGLTRALPPMADVLQRVKEMVEPLQLPAGTSHLSGREGLGALAALARLYLATGRYVEAAVTLREGWITRYGGEAADCPGTDRYEDEARARAERRWRHLCGHTAETIGQVRNDIQHGGYRTQPTPAATLRRQLQELAEQFEAAAAEPLPGSVFLNLSNHPLSEWPEEQLAAARALCREVVDLPFPVVDPEADAASVARLAADVLAQVPEATTHAMVQGEFTLTGILVRELSGRGILCFAATTARAAEPLGDGRTARSYRFIRFRPYAPASF